ncbi:ankyrin repeat domain-containing protein [Candidatus Dependentiae bacterium]|nr:ankyrin repeat domain-containing protein [Candidatus Dependentiae bacterium]
MFKRIMITFCFGIAYVQGVRAMDSGDPHELQAVPEEQVIHSKAKARSLRLSERALRAVREVNELERANSARNKSLSSLVPLVSTESGPFVPQSPRSVRSPRKAPHQAPDSPTTQLMCGVLERNFAAVHALLSPLDINRQYAQYNGDTCLHIACKEGESRIVEQLLKTSDINVNLKNFNGDTPLHLAARGGHCEIVSMLLWFPSIIPNIMNEVGDTPLHDAAKASKEESLQALLLSLNVDLKSRNHAGHSYKFYIKRDEKIKSLMRETLKIREKMVAEQGGITSSSSSSSSSFH